MIQQKTLSFPIKYGIAYSAFTFLMYLFGVWKYPNSNRFILILLVAVYNIAMLLGFSYGSKRNYTLSFGKTDHFDTRVKPDADFFVWKLYKICFWATMILFIPRFIIFTGLYNGFNITSIIQRIQFTVSDVNEAYILSHTSGNSATGIWKIINLFCVFGGGFVWCYTPLVIALWGRINKFHKVFAVIYWLVYCVQYIISATNSGVVGQIFYIVVSIAFVQAYKRRFNTSVVSKRKHRIRLFFVGVIGIALILFVFGFAMSSRVGINYRNKQIGISSIMYNDSSIFNLLTPEFLHPTVATADSYLTQGYNALEMSISLPWEPTFLLGNSRFIMNNFQELTGIDFFNQTYQVRLYNITGWHYDIYWHTAFLWLANDFSLWGLPVFLYFLFLYFGTSWRRFIISNNIVGYLVIVLFAQFMFYISANNTLFSYSDTLLAFIFVGIWMIKSKQFNWGNFNL